MIYENDQLKTINILNNFDREKPTHMATTHAQISKVEQKFQRRIPKEFDQNFYIPRFSVIHRTIFNNRLLKILNKKVLMLLSRGVQPKCKVSTKFKENDICCCLGSLFVFTCQIN